MRDHGLFQAICRVNRLDGDDKEYGYVIDYKDLFKSSSKGVKDYTSEALDQYDKEDVEGLLKDRVAQAKEHLEDALEAIRAVVEPVEKPKDSAAYLRYFCTTEPGDAAQLKDNEPKRAELYKLVMALSGPSPLSPAMEGLPATRPLSSKRSVPRSERTRQRGPR